MVFQYDKQMEKVEHQIIEHIIIQNDWTSIFIASITVIITASGVVYSIIRGIRAEKNEREARETADTKEREARETADTKEREARETAETLERESRKLEQDVIKKQQNLEFTKLIELFQSEIRLLLNKKVAISTKEEYQRFTKDYLDILDRLAYLKKLNKIDEQLIEYFKLHFQYGQFLINNFNKAASGLQPLEKNYPNFVYWVDEIGLEPKKFEMDKKLKKLFNIKE